MPMSTLDEITQCEANQIAIEERAGTHKPRMSAKDAAVRLFNVFKALRNLLPDEGVGDLSGLIADQEKWLAGH
jgi:hypothetical protein